MKPKQLILVVVLAVVLGGLGWWIRQRDQSAYQTSGVGQGLKILTNFPLNEVARVVIKEGTNELTLAKELDLWRVRERHNYPANFTEVGGLIRKIWELKPVQSETVGESQLGRLQLLEPGPGTNTATRVDFQDGSGKPLASVLLGRKQMQKSSEPASPFGGGEGWPKGRWVRVVGRVTAPAHLVSEAFTEVEAKADRWLNKDFFKVEKLKSVEVTHLAATNSWKIYRETENGELKLEAPKDSEKLDTGKASSVGNALSWPTFVDVLAPDSKPEDTGLHQPIVASLQTFDGFTYRVRLGKKSGTEDNYALQVAVSAEIPSERTAAAEEKAEDKERLDKEFKERKTKLEEKLKLEKSFEPWIFSVSKWTVDPLLKERREYLAEEKKPEADAGAPLPTPPAADGDEDEEESADGDISVK